MDVEGERSLTEVLKKNGCHLPEPEDNEMQNIQPENEIPSYQRRGDIPSIHDLSDGNPLFFLFCKPISIAQK